MKPVSLPQARRVLALVPFGLVSLAGAFLVLPGFNLTGGWRVVREEKPLGGLLETLRLGSHRMSVNEREISLRSHGRTVQLAIPFAGGGEVSVKASILDSSDGERAASNDTIRTPALGTGHQVELLSLPIPPESIDVGVDRIRYELTDRGRTLSGIVPVSALWGRLELSLFGQRELLAGSRAGLRVIAWDRDRDAAVEGATVHLALADGTPLFDGRTDRQGTAELAFGVPESKEGRQRILLHLSSPLGERWAEADVTIRRAHRILLTTDKPIYQPGQTMHIRALALSEVDLKPMRGKELTLEVEDARGNKVMKRVIRTNRFGIVGANFALAGEVNMGRYTIRARITRAAQEDRKPHGMPGAQGRRDGDGAGGGRNDGDGAGGLPVMQAEEEETQEKTVTVERYVLPKFKIQFSTDKPYYLPGQTVRGEIQADYFFGKPVAGGRVRVAVSSFDAGYHEFQAIQARTDERGHAVFEAELPAYFAGLPLEQGNAFVRFAIAVTDKADHQETREETRPVSQDPIVVRILPESRMLKAGLDNTVHVLASYPDGTPVNGWIRLQSPASASSRRADRFGIAEFCVPGRNAPMVLASSATDAAGNSGQSSLTTESEAGDAFISLRTGRSLYKAGEVVPVQVFATRESGTVYLDVIRGSQTILTRSAPLLHGLASIDLALSPEQTGSLWLHAYLVTRGADMVRDTKVIYVNPANDLNIAVNLAKATFLPGEDAAITFRVTDPSGHPVYAALGIQIVDEAVFARVENQPGMEKVYFTLEKELLEPRIEIHGFGPAEVVGSGGSEQRPAQGSADGARQHAAAILFNQATRMVQYALQANTAEDEQRAVQSAFMPRLQRDWTEVAQALSGHRSAVGRVIHPDRVLTPSRLRKCQVARDLRDPWGSPYSFRDVTGDGRFTLVSAGPDKALNTTDDLLCSGRLPALEMMDAVALGVAPPGMAAPRDLRAGSPLVKVQITRAATMAPAALGQGAQRDRFAAGSGGSEEPRVRGYFPETMLAEPSLLTDAAGRAVLAFGSYH